MTFSTIAFCFRWFETALSHQRYRSTVQHNAQILEEPWRSGSTCLQPLLPMKSTWALGMVSQRGSTASNYPRTCVSSRKPCSAIMEDSGRARADHLNTGHSVMTSARSWQASQAGRVNLPFRFMTAAWRQHVTDSAATAWSAQKKSKTRELAAKKTQPAARNARLVCKVWKSDPVRR